MKERWTVQIEIDPEEDFENTDHYVTVFEPQGVVRYRLGVPVVLLPWKLLKREPVKQSKETP